MPPHLNAERPSHRSKANGTYISKRRSLPEPTHQLSLFRQSEKRELTQNLGTNPLLS